MEGMQGEEEKDYWIGWMDEWKGYKKNLGGNVIKES